MGIFTIGGQVRRREDVTIERDKLKDRAEGIFVQQTEGAKLLEGMMETWDRRFEDDDAWPIFVLILGDGADTSGYVNEDEYIEFVDELRRREASTHAVVLNTGRGGSARCCVCVLSGISLFVGARFGLCVVFVGVARCGGRFGLGLR